MLDAKRQILFLIVTHSVLLGCVDQSSKAVVTPPSASRSDKQPVAIEPQQKPEIAPDQLHAKLSTERPGIVLMQKESAEPKIEKVEKSPIQLRDVTLESGVQFVHTDGSSGKRYIIETVASGMATFDYDGDGLIDIYFVNGAPLQGTTVETVPYDRLYRNLGNWKFEDVTEEAGVGDTNYGLGVTAGDFDNDGNPDLYVSNLNRNVMYHNNGDGTFTDITDSTKTAAEDPWRVGAGPAFLDIEADGDLDLFVANYLHFSYDEKYRHTWKGVHIYSSPDRFPPYVSMLFRNEGDGTFTDISQPSGVQARVGHGMGIVCADVDEDGDTDVFLNNDGNPGNFLFRNDGHGKFDEVAVESGTAYSSQGLALGCMGVDCGDIDNDGLLDFYVTAYQHQLSRLFRNRGKGVFEDITMQAGAGAGTYNQVTWGCGIVDLDNDGLRDVFLACGHLIDNVHLVDDTTSYTAKPLVMRNIDGQSFANVTAGSGDGLKKESVARGAAFDDLDNDGDVDVVISNSRRAPTLLANDSPQDHHWLEVELRGTQVSRDAIGARVKVIAGDLVQVSEIHSGRGYQGHFGSRLHFGLARHSMIDRIEVTWLGGGSDVVQNVAADQLVRIVEGQEDQTDQSNRSDPSHHRP